MADAELASELRMGVMRLARRLRQQRTESGLTLTQLSALGNTTALQFLPVLLLSLWGGVVADRLPKRPVLLITQAAAGLQALVLGVLVLSGHARIWQVFETSWPVANRRKLRLLSETNVGVTWRPPGVRAAGRPRAAAHARRCRGRSGARPATPLGACGRR